MANFLFQRGLNFLTPLIRLENEETEERLDYFLALLNKKASNTAEELLNQLFYTELLSSSNMKYKNAHDFLIIALITGIEWGMLQKDCLTYLNESPDIMVVDLMLDVVTASWVKIVFSVLEIWSSISPKERFLSCFNLLAMDTYIPSHPAERINLLRHIMFSMNLIRIIIHFSALIDWPWISLIGADLCNHLILVLRGRFCINGQKPAVDRTSLTTSPILGLLYGVLVPLSFTEVLKAFHV